MRVVNIALIATDIITIARKYRGPGEKSYRDICCYILIRMFDTGVWSSVRSKESICNFDSMSICYISFRHEDEILLTNVSRNVSRNTGFSAFSLCWLAIVIKNKTRFVFMIFWSSHSRHYDRIMCVINARTQWDVWSNDFECTRSDRKAVRWHETPVKGRNRVSKEPLFCPIIWRW